METSSVVFSFNIKFFSVCLLRENVAGEKVTVHHILSSRTSMFGIPFTVMLGDFLISFS